MNRFDLRKFVLETAGRVLKLSTVANLSSRFGWVRATNVPIRSGSGQSPNQPTQSSRNMCAFGVRSMPVAGSEVVIGAMRAGSSNTVILASDHLGYGPSDLAEGECAIYSSADKSASGVQQTCRVRLGADGKISVDSKSDQDVVVNGGTKKVARITDTVNIGAWSVVVGGGGAVTAIKVVPPNGGLPVTLPVDPLPGVSLSAQISSGADRFKA